MTVKYAPNELLSITDFTKKIAAILKGIKEESCEKIGILKNNKLEAVVISTDEYEHRWNINKFLKPFKHEKRHPCLLIFLLKH